jgi:outer membrane lipoprotein-sorting protein
MKSINLRLFCVVVLLCVINISAQDKDEIYKKLISKYGKISSVFVVFDSDDGQIKNCILNAKRGNKYSITMNNNKIVSDGKTIWNYNFIKKNVVISEFIPEIAGITMDYFFFNVFNNLQPMALKSITSAAKGKNYYLELKNKDNTQEIQNVNIFLDSTFSKIIGIELYANGNYQKWKINKIEINKSIPESTFKFKTPKGVEEIDMR